MTVTIQLSPDIEAGLVVQAQAQGLPLQAYLEEVLRKQVPPQSYAGLSPAERAAAWRKSVEGLPDTPPLSDEAISRDNLYRGQH
jgi:hypothetical protein